MGLSFDHLNNTCGFGIDPSDGRSGAKRPIQPPFASLPSFFRTFIPVDRLASPKRLTGRPAEHLRGSCHAILTSSAILWFLRQKRETAACVLRHPLRSANRNKACRPRVRTLGLPQRGTWATVIEQNATVAAVPTRCVVMCSAPSASDQCISSPHAMNSSRNFASFWRSKLRLQIEACCGKSLTSG
jgi:hypothetical protein